MADKEKDERQHLYLLEPYLKPGKELCKENALEKIDPPGSAGISWEVIRKMYNLL